MSKSDLPTSSKDSLDGNELDPERAAIRNEISGMSIEELLALKEKIGSKMFDESLGLNKKSPSKNKFKRENKNRPRMEPISKKPVKRSRDVVGVKSENKKDFRDPRFDPLCGDFDEKIFKDSYKFVDNLKDKELKTLKRELKVEEDPERKEQIKYLIQRMENQAREKNKIEKKKKDKNDERLKNKELLKEGKAPVFLNKSERKKKELVEQFEELKSSGRIDNYLKKKAKKNMIKDKKKMSSEKN